jgi:predicted dithiol-disulfide oxidoreductase (DUF899 family)
VGRSAQGALGEGKGIHAAARRIEPTTARAPWEAVTKDYAFEGPDGRETLSQLFGRRSQLVVYHFMFGPDWDGDARTARAGRTISTASSCTSRSAT